MTRTQPVGLIGLEDLAGRLTRAGFSVVGGGEFRGAARAILDTKTSMPILVGATGGGGSKTWLERAASNGNTVVVLRGPGHAETVGATMVDLPVALADVLELAGLPSDGGRFRIEPDFSVVPATSPPFASKPAKKSPVAPKPAVPAATFEPSWGDDTEDAPAPRNRPAEPTVPAEPETDPWASPVEVDPWGAPVPSVPDLDDLDDDTDDDLHDDADPWAAAPAEKPPWGDPDPEDDSDDDPWTQSAPARSVANTPTEDPWGQAPVAHESAPPPRSAAMGPVTMRKPVDPLFEIDITTATPATSGGRVASRRGTLAPVIFVLGAKGGPGKSTTSLCLAEFAANRGLKVDLIDMNRGQGDIRKYLRIPPSAGLKSVYDAAVSRDPSVALNSPTDVTTARHQSLPPVKFGVSLAPLPDQADPNLVNSSVYRSVIERARREMDLVVVDTQIMESHDTSALHDDVVVPILASQGAWGVAVTIGSGVSVSNLSERLTKMAGQGVPRDRMLLVYNDVEEKSIFASQDTIDQFNDRAKFVGVIHHKAEVRHMMDVGRLPVDNPEFTPVLESILHQVTGLEVFVPSAPTVRSSSSKRPWWKFWAAA